MRGKLGPSQVWPEICRGRGQAFTLSRSPGRGSSGQAPCRLAALVLHLPGAVVGPLGQAVTLLFPQDQGHPELSVHPEVNSPRPWDPNPAEASGISAKGATKRALSGCLRNNTGDTAWH